MKKDKLKASKKIFTNFTMQHDIVEFGEIRSSDDIDRIKGLTLQSRSIDHNFAHGTIDQREISLLLREFELKDFKKGSSTAYTWNILALDLAINDIPSLFVDSHQGDNTLYNHIVGVTNQFGHISEAFNSNISFNSAFHVFGSIQHAAELTNYLNDHVMQNMYDYYRSLSFETVGSKLLIYSDSNNSDLRTLNKMLEAGRWLAEYFEYADAYQHKHSGVLSFA